MFSIVAVLTFLALRFEPSRFFLNLDKLDDINVCTHLDQPPCLDIPKSGLVRCKRNTNKDAELQDAESCIWKRTKEGLDVFCEKRRVRRRGAIFFSANEDCISANHMARILIWRRISLPSRKHLQYVYAHVHVHTMYLKYAPYDWLKYWGMAILVCRKKIADGGGGGGVYNKTDKWTNQQNQLS